MKLSNIKSPEKRARYAAKVRKRIGARFKSPVRTVPVFITGIQRSGTTMLMNTFHLHEATEVFDEEPNSRVFIDYRIRSDEILDQSIRNSRYPFACYKIISDSHILNEFLQRYPESFVIWAYRSCTDNADSQLKKFPHATDAIRRVCDGRPGGGWFAEGCSEQTKQTLRALDTREFSDFDFACLVWWARNVLYFEGGHDQQTNVRLLSYENTARDPATIMEAVQAWVGMPISREAGRFVHARSVAKKDLPTLHPSVAALCQPLEAQLNDKAATQW
ncbi:MAG: sulfotransferase domain-containing protein [Pseudomonadota bacterium]